MDPLEMMERLASSQAEAVRLQTEALRMLRCEMLALRLGFAAAMRDGATETRTAALKRLDDLGTGARFWIGDPVPTDVERALVADAAQSIASSIRATPPKPEDD